MVYETSGSREDNVKIYFDSGGPFVRRSGTICAVLVEGIEENFCEII